MGKIRDKGTIRSLFKDGQTVMIGGFANHGNPRRLIDILVESGARDLTVISNDSGDPDVTTGRLVRSGQAVKFICSHVGMNPEMGKAFAEGRIKVELNPQGTLAERIRSGGSGIGGVLLRTGLGTVIEQGKRKIEVDGVEYLLETALTADVALVHAQKADAYGNLVYRGTSRNFNPLVAMAGKIVVVEAEEIVPVGSLGVDEIHTPGIFVSMILANE